MSATIRMRIEGIEGESTTKGYENWLVVESVDFNVMRSISMQSGISGGSENSMPNIAPISIVKRAGKASAKLFEDSLIGQGKPAEIVFLTTGPKPSCFLEIKLKHAMVSRFSFSVAQGGDSAFIEHFDINFNDIEYRYTPHDKDMKAGSPISVSYDLATQKANS